jgi:serine/threonine-protein kinase
MPTDVQREDRLDEILASYLKAVEDGSAPPRQALLDTHPDLADDLADFFTDQDRIHRMAAPLRTATPDVLPPGVRDFGDYEVQEEIARGGMGVVFKAWQKSLNRTVALKMLLAGPLASPDDLRRFRAEAEAAARLDHPNIVPIHDVGVHAGCAYLSMKLLPGGSLAQAAARPITPRDAARLVATAADAVHFAHQRGVLHRDLKPANILLDEQGRPYVTDFGLAKRTPVWADHDATQAAPPPTHTGAIVGTPAYMAPEQARGDRDGVTVAADVYGLGAVLYELLTGKAPFRAETPLETLRLVLETEPRRPRALNAAVDRDLDTICLKCLAKDPTRRYASAADLAADLRRFLAGQPILARRAGPVERLVRSVRRHPVVSVLVLALVVTLAGGLTIITALWLRAETTGIGLAAALETARSAKTAAEAETARAEGEKARADQNAADAEARRQKVEADFHQAHDTIRQIRQLCENLSKISGTQPVRRQLLQTVLDYEEEFVRQRGDDPKLRRERAEAQFDAAQITAEIGTNADALTAYRRAAGLYRDLHEADPQDVDLQRSYISSVNNAGVHEPNVESKQADFQEARRLYEEFLCFHPDDERLLNGLGSTLDNIGSGYLNSGRFREAQYYLDQAVEIQEDLFHRDEHRIAFTNDLATTNTNLGALYTRLPGKYVQAKRCYERAVDLYGRLAEAFPSEAVRQANYAAALNALGIVHRDHGDYDKALEVLQKAQEVRQKVADDNPTVGRYQVDLALSLSNVGVTYARKGDRPKSLAMHEQARDILDRLCKQDPNSPWARKYLASEWYNIGAANGEMGRWADEARAMAQARPLQEKLVTDDPSNFDCRCDLGRTMCDLGLALLRVNRPDEAREALRAGIASLREGVERSPEAAGDLRWLMNGQYLNLSMVERTAGRPNDAVAATLDRLNACAPDADEFYRGALEFGAALPLYGRGKAELSPEEQAGRDRCAGLAVAALRQAAAKGFRDLDRVRKDRELDSLRSRDDFRAIVADLEKNDKKPE